MTAYSPLKPKRSAGGFFVVWQGETAFWIDEQYHLYKHETMLTWSIRDRKEFAHDRKDFIDSADKIEIDGFDYYVRFDCEISDEIKRKIIIRFHNSKTQTLRTLE